MVGASVHPISEARPGVSWVLGPVQGGHWAPFNKLGDVELGFQLDTGACSHSISQVRAPNARVPETQVSLLPVGRTQNVGV